MPKQKLFLKPKKKQSPQVPTTADEFLVAGVDFEEAGEKWRAGDAAKSCRFFVRAIETYDGGLQRFPRSFDLAYNKARIQYDLCQRPRLLQHIPTPLIDQLQLALQSHRYASSLEPENADVLFNTAQVLTSLTEILSEGVTDKEEGLQLLQEALELFWRCLLIQRSQFAQAEADAQAIANKLESDQNDVFSPPSSSPMSDLSTKEQWASIFQPVTKSTLIDTVTAMTEALTDVCNLGVFQDTSRLSWIENFYRENVERMFSIYAESSTTQLEAYLARANFLCAFADASFRIGRLALADYEHELQNTFSTELDLSDSPQGLCDRADAMLAFNSSVRVCVNYVDLQPSDAARLNQVQWRHLSNALKDLKLASALPDVQNLPKIHIRRGDCELFRYRLGDAPTSYQVARSNALTLLENAETYYRGAAGFAKAEGAEKEEYEARVKQAIVSSVKGDHTKLLERLREGRDMVVPRLRDAQDEGLIANNFLETLNLL